jgi:hypothetical protein
MLFFRKRMMLLGYKKIKLGKMLVKKTIKHLIRLTFNDILLADLQNRQNDAFSNWSKLNLRQVFLKVKFLYKDGIKCRWGSPEKRLKK